MGIVRMPLPKSRQQLQRPLRLMLVPQIDEVKLVVGFASHDLATSSCAEHFLQPLAAVASGEEQQPSQELGGRGRHIGVVVVQTDAEVGVLHRRVEGDRPLQGVLGPPSVKRGAQPFAAQDAPLRPRAVGASQVKPGFRSLRVALDPPIHASAAAMADSTRDVKPASRVVLKGSSWIRHQSATASSTRQASPGAAPGAGPQACASKASISSNRASKMAS